jgi:DNA-binding NarL/FixJ family response regulator
VDELNEQMLKSRWDLIIVDIDQHVELTAEIMQQIKSNVPSAKTIFFYEHANRNLLAAYRMGLKGSFSKIDSKENVELAIKTVAAGEVYVPQSVILNLICEGHIMTNFEHKLSLLSDKENLLLNHLSKGKRMKEITQLMHLAPSTLSTHKRRIMHKMGIQSSQEFNSFVKAYKESLKGE